MDVFESPGGERPSSAPGLGLDLGQAIADGLNGMLRNLVPMTAVVFIGIVAYFLAICTCIGWIAIVPLLMWGVYAFVLQMVDGDAHYTTVLSGTDDFARVFTSMWGWVLLFTLLYIPAVLLGIAPLIPMMVEAIPRGETVDPLQITLYTSVPVFIWSLLLVRLMVAPFLIVDGGRGVIEAFSDAWSLTAGHWGKLIVLQIVLTLLSLPAQVLSLGSQMLSQDIDPFDTQAQLDALGIQMGLSLAVMVLGILSGLLGLAIFASAYRQLTGTGEPEVA